MEERKNPSLDSPSIVGRNSSSYDASFLHATPNVSSNRSSRFIVKEIKVQDIDKQKKNNAKAHLDSDKKLEEIIRTEFECSAHIDSESVFRDANSKQSMKTLNRFLATIIKEDDLGDDPGDPHYYDSDIVLKIQTIPQPQNLSMQSGQIMSSNDWIN